MESFQSSFSDLAQPSFEPEPPPFGLDRIAQLATTSLDVWMVAICLPGERRHWCQGCAVPQSGGTLLAQDFYQDVADSEAVLTVADARYDPRLARLAQVEGPPYLRAFAAIPLVAPDDRPLGVLCVARAGGQPFDEKALGTLADLAALTVVQVALRVAARGPDSASQRPGRGQFIEDVGLLHANDPGRPQVCILIDLAERRYSSDVTRVLGAIRWGAVIDEAAAMIARVLPPGLLLYQVDVATFALVTRRAARAEWLSLVGSLVARMRSGAAINQFPFLEEAAVGVAPFQPGEHPACDLLRVAGIAADAARGSSQGWATHDPAANEAQQRAFRLLTDLHPVVNSNRHAQKTASCQLSLHYQPRVSLETGVCVGAEALLRWLHPELGAIGPAETTPWAERSALPSPLIEWVVENALAQSARWQADGLELHLAINISAVNLQEPDFAERMASRLRRHGTPPERLTLEFTETALLADTACSVQQLEALAELGLTLAIDDYGTGYANLSYLQRVPASVLKLGGAFIGRLPGTQRDRAIVRNTIRMAHELGYRVVAEAVDAPVTSGLLREWGCDEAQGEVFGGALAPGGFLSLLKETQAERAIPRRML